LQIKKFAPFGDGPRACIGLPMGIMGYMAAMTRLWSSFHFELAASVRPPLVTFGRFALYTITVAQSVAQLLLPFI
jgi:cytochrome P450